MSDDKPFGLSEIGQIAITVRDLPLAVAFYRDVLGMQFLFEAPNLAFFACGSVRLMLGPPESEELDHPSSIVYYKVADIRAAHETLAQRGVRFIHEPRVVHRTDQYELWMAFFHDPDENPIALMCEISV